MCRIQRNRKPEAICISDFWHRTWREFTEEEFSLRRDKFGLETSHRSHRPTAFGEA